jgi:hypothetical protein
MVELYENVFNAQPKNEEFGIQWFMAMVRNSDYKGQQQAAVKLQRVFKKDKYLFWAIMSLALQVGSTMLNHVTQEPNVRFINSETYRDNTETNYRTRWRNA